MTNKSKRKLHKSGSEKVSPKDKKSKSIKDHLTSATMASKFQEQSEASATEDSSGQQSVHITLQQWQDLMSKIDNISTITNEVRELRLKINDMEEKLNTMKAGNEELGNTVGTLHTTVESLGRRVLEVEKTQDLIALVDSELKATEHENKALKEQILLQETYSRRENLVFEGIKEVKGEDTQRTLQKFLATELDMKSQSSSMLITRCHRLSVKNSSHRPIIARFVMDSDRRIILNRKYMLKNTGFFIREDLPGEIVSRRKLMYPLFVKAKKSDREARIIRDKVTYNKKSYGYNQAYELAEILQFYSHGQRKDSGLIAFHGRSSYLSNFFPATFKEGSSVYSCSEQMYQHELCLFFGDAKAARSVMLQSDPVSMKNIGDQMLRMNKVKAEQWFQFHARRVMKSAVLQKFTQNSAIREQLLQLNGTLLEANQYDSRWGIGLSIRSDEWKDKNKWKGSNWLGEIIQEVRDELKP